MKDVMREAILSFPKQFQYEPVTENAVGSTLDFNKFALFGMGGSGLAADIIHSLNPDLDVVGHKNYGLPNCPDLKERLLIFISYSGNTEETLDAFESALKGGYHLAVITTGGKFLERAKQLGILYVQLPDTGIQPRMSVGMQVRAVLKLAGKQKLYAELGKLDKTLDAEKLESEGKALAKKLAGQIPIVYSSQSNQPLAYYWKITLNETGKVPAFYNVFPELNHNEISGFDTGKDNKSLVKAMHAVFIKDSTDQARVGKRMTVLQKVYDGLGLSVDVMEARGKTQPESFFRMALLADWTAYYIAKDQGSDPNAVPLVEEFKKKLQ